MSAQPDVIQIDITEAYTTPLYILMVMVGVLMLERFVRIWLKVHMRNEIARVAAEVHA